MLKTVLSVSSPMSILDMDAQMNVFQLSSAAEMMQLMKQCMARYTAVAQVIGLTLY